MPEVRLLVPYTDKDGNHYAADEIVEFDKDTVATLRADGKASLIEDEEKAEKAAKEGNFSARTSRENVAGTKAEEPKKEKK
jgi:hypothetical protein